MQTENARQQAFIQAYLRTGDKRLAYKTAYPEIADGDSLRVASNRLFRKLRTQIDALESRARELALEEMMSDAKQRIKTEICSMQQRREVLAEIILGRRKQVKHIRLKDRVVEVEEDINPNAIIRAIDLDSRLAANKYKEKGIEYKQPDKAPAMFPIGVANKDAPDTVPDSTGVNTCPVDKDDILPLDERLNKYPYGHGYWKGKYIRLHGTDVQKYGFDILEEGIPYLKGELTEAFKEMRFLKDVEDFKRDYPEQAKEIFGTKHTLPVKQQTEETETKRNNDNPESSPFIEDTNTIETEYYKEKELTAQWAQFLKLDTNTGKLSAADRKRKETWFRLIPEKQRLKLIGMYKRTA